MTICAMKLNELRRKMRPSPEDRVSSALRTQVEKRTSRATERERARRRDAERLR